MLHISNLTITYGTDERPALENFSLKADNNSLIVIAGNSGSGKSTLARSFLHLLPNECKISGAITIDDFNINELDNQELFKKIGFLPQFPMDYILNLLVYDEIAFPLENLGYSKKEIFDKILKILDKLKISHLKHRIITEISAGELQKVALATALITNPSIVILDEPFARMDSNSEIALINYLKELKKNSIIIILEHHLDYILEIADYVFFLNEGKVVFQGIPQNIISKLNENRPEISDLHIPPDKTNYTSYKVLLKDLQDYLKKEINGRIL